VATSERVRMANQVLSMGEEGNTYWVFVGKPDGERLLGKCGYRWEENVKIYFKFYACGSVHLVLKLSMIPNETYTFCGLRVFYCSLYMFRAN
jgi:hypothetical protein